MNPDLSHRLAVARRAAAAAGDYLFQALWDDHRVTAQGAYDVHLAADAEASRLIRDALVPEFPGEFVLEEDGEADPGSDEWVWIVDPLDGTVNYLHRLPWFCVSIACYHRTGASDHPLWRHGRPAVAVVRAPALGQEFWAWAGGGSWGRGAGDVFDRRLSVTADDLGRGLLSCSRGSRADDQAWVRDFLDEVGPRARKTRNQGAAALDLAYVAQGSLAAHVQRSIQVWDVAAGALLVAEAGGVVSALAGPAGVHVAAAGPAAYQNFVALWEEVSPCGS